MFFSVDFELLGEIKPHDLKPGGADIQVFVLIHPGLFILLTFVNPKLLSYISFPFIHPELLSFVSLFFLHLNFYHLPHPSWNSSFSWICVHAFSTSIFFSLFLILNLSKFTFSLSLSRTLKLLYRWLRRTRRSTWAWSLSGGWPGKQCWTELFWYLGAWVLGTCYLVLTWYLGLVLGTWYLGLVTKLRMKR